MEYIKMKKIFGLLLIIMVFAGCGYSFEKDGIYAVIKTNMGEMIFNLNYDKTPVTTGSFIGLAEGTKEFIDEKTGEKAKRPFYNGLIFHRVIKDFVIQGGCPLGTGAGTPGYSFVDEFNPGLKHDSAGVLSMANSGPNTNGSQFFVTLAPAPHLDGKHTVWGKIVNGMNVLEKIGNVKTDRSDKPVKDVIIESVTIKRIGKEAKEFNAEIAFSKNETILKELEIENTKKLQNLLEQLNVKEQRIVTTNTGLRYFIRKYGKGSSPLAGDNIIAHYSGYLVDGTKFDSSIDRNQPFQTVIGVGNVIKGWDEAFLGMKKGEKRVLIIPYELGYGLRGNPPVIPPKATLIFEVELIDFQKK
jgi:peptidyl-prolyl cis-trans isomerase A (cyclophilin A)